MPPIGNGSTRASATSRPSVSVSALTVLPSKARRTWRAGCGPSQNTKARKPMSSRSPLRTYQPPSASRVGSGFSISAL